MFEGCYILHFAHSDLASAGFAEALGLIGFGGRYEFVRDLPEARHLLLPQASPPHIIVAEGDQGPSSEPLLQWLRTRPEAERVPVVVYSEEANNTAFAEALQAGAIGYLMKSKDLDQTIRQVRRLLEFCQSGV